MNKQVLTIAIGKKNYVDMAINLARSFMFWNKETGIKFYLATDLPQYLPHDVKTYINIIKLTPSELGTGFSAKLHLDKLAPPGQTLFIDSDCLIFGEIKWVFDTFKGRDVSVIGNYISAGEWFGDIQKVCKEFNVVHLPKFNGGIYYLEKGSTATNVYNTARELEKKYDKIGFVRLRNKPNDEVIMALAMQLHEQELIIDEGTIMSDPQACPGGYMIDVITGNRWLINPPAPDSLHQDWYPFEKVSPVVVHFLGYYTSCYPYQKQSYRLQKALSKRLNWFTELVGLVSIEYPARITEQMKSLLRPTYRKLLGYRKVKISERI